MNAPVKPPSLAELHRARSELLKKQAALTELHGKLSAVDHEAEKADAALKNAGAASSADYENWVYGGCKGDAPGTDSTMLAALHEAHIRAQHELTSAVPAKRNVEARGREIAVALQENRTAVEDAVALLWAGAFKELGTDREKLLAKVAEIDGELIAGKDFFSVKAEYNRGRAPFSIAKAAAETALGGISPPIGSPLAVMSPSLVLASGDPARIRGIEAAFDKLVTEGK